MNTESNTRTNSSDNHPNPRDKKRSWKMWAAFLASLILVFALGLLAASIIERRSESLIAYKPTQGQIQDFESDSAVWGKLFPREFSSYLKTSETTFLSKYNGSTVRDALEERPLMVVLWAGYAFASDYHAPRGHSYAIQDVRETLRTGAPKDEKSGPQPGTCWTCKSPDVPRMMQQVGIANFYKEKWAHWGKEIVNSIGCADCHNPQTMDLTITRPALVEAFDRQGIDIKKATHQEKRSLVCAQCHVEYYFKGDGKYLTFPWDKGSSVEEIEAYYDEVKHVDWVHKLSKAPMLKAQHPDFEIWKMGVHSRRGVSCADCHMPYTSEGGVKFTDHHIQSPLAKVSKTCQTCHRESEDELKQNVYSHQDKIATLRALAEDSLAKAHIEAKEAWEKGATEVEMGEILKLLRQAQWRWDFAVAGHGNAFHAPVETARILGHSVDKAQEARRLLAKVLAIHGVTTEVAMPDLSSKEKAQSYIGLDIEKMKAEKQEFKEQVLPTWNRK